MAGAMSVVDVAGAITVHSIFAAATFFNIFLKYVLSVLQKCDCLKNTHSVLGSHSNLQ